MTVSPLLTRGGLWLASLIQRVCTRVLQVVRDCALRCRGKGMLETSTVIVEARTRLQRSVGAGEIIDSTCGFILAED